MKKLSLSFENQLVFMKVFPNLVLIIKKAILTFQNINDFLSNCFCNNE